MFCFLILSLSQLAFSFPEFLIIAPFINLVSAQSLSLTTLVCDHSDVLTLFEGR